jgi:hypothetical protein
LFLLLLLFPYLLSTRGVSQTKKIKNKKLDKKQFPGRKKTTKKPGSRCEREAQKLVNSEHKYHTKRGKQSPHARKEKRRQAKAMIACRGARARARGREKEKTRTHKREKRDTKTESAKGQCATAHKWKIARTRSNPSQTINASYLPRLPKLTTPTKDDVPLAEPSPHPLFLPPMMTSLAESSNTLLPVIF